MSSGRIDRAPLGIVGLIILVVGIGGGAGVYFAADRREAVVQRDERVQAVLSANTGAAENYLIVGSDSRAPRPREQRPGRLPVLGHDHGPPPRSRPRGDAAQPAVGPVGRRRRLRTGQAQLRLHPRLGGPRPDCAAGPRHPDRPLRRDRLRRVQGARRRDRRGRGVRRLRVGRPQHRDAAAAGLPGRRRRRRLGVRPLPALP